MRAWWHGLQPRERRTLVLGAAALGIVLFYLLVWRPPHAAIESLRERTTAQREDLAWLQRAAAEAKQLRKTASQPASGGRALYALADETAKAAGLGDALQRVEPSGTGRVRVGLDNAAFDRLVRWLATLRRRYGIEAAPVSLRRTDPGRVDAQLELNGGGQ